MDGTREHWAHLVTRWRRSGQTARVFARRARINTSTLAYWAWRLKREDASRRRKTLKSRRSTAVVDGASFVELVPGGFEEQRFEIELVDGRRVSIPANFDSATLERLLTVLDGTGR